MRKLFLDIETFPNIIYTWGLYEQNSLSVKEDWVIACFSAKWEHGEHITKALPDYKGYNPKVRDDKALVKELWNLLDSADIVVAQNGDKFDIKKMNARFAVHGMTPPSPYKTVDTLKVAKSTFGFDSNKLNELGRQLGHGEKKQTGGFKLWMDCMSGIPSAWKRMKLYNKQDVILLEKVYNHFLPWTKNHPNMGLYLERLVCKNCASKNTVYRGFSYTTSGKYREYRCKDCGASNVSRKAEPRIETFK